MVGGRIHAVTALGTARVHDLRPELARRARRRAWSGGTHSTVYGAAGAVIAATRIVLSGSCFRPLMSETNLLTGVKALSCSGYPCSQSN